jgi:hypothetical protein
LAERVETFARNLLFIYFYAMGSIPNINEWIQHFRTCSPGEISQLVSKEIPQDRLPIQYLESLSDEDRTVCFRASIICWAITGRAIVPREFQLRTALIAAGMGSGKTLPIALCILLDNPADNFITLTISPLK